MPHGLKRYQQAESLHFITFSCYHRLPFLSEPHPKTILEAQLERTRNLHDACIYAYVLMPGAPHLDLRCGSCCHQPRVSPSTLKDMRSRVHHHRPESDRAALQPCHQKPRPQDATALPKTGVERKARKDC